MASDFTHLTNLINSHKPLNFCCIDMIVHHPKVCNDTGNNGKSDYAK